MDSLVSLSDRSIILGEPGVGRTTLALVHARTVLEDGGRVAWISPEAPHPARIKSILGPLGPSTSARFIALFDSDVARSIGRISHLIPSLSSLRLIVVDDYCPATGRVPSSMDGVLSDLATVAVDTRVLLTATAGSDVSGKTDKKVPIDGLSMRHSSFLLSNEYDPLWIERLEMGRRRLHVRGSAIWLTLVDSGLEFSVEE